MLYFKCPTCKTILANKQITYESKMDEICNNPTMPEETKNKMKKQILDDLFLHRYCCRMRIMGYVRLIDEIV
jgi:DNA-directed RNA polymerase subunit N (RpoN/RPB10)